MKIQYKHQRFQADAAKAVVDVFAGQPYLTPSYMMDMGVNYQRSFTDDEDFTGWSNQRIVPELNDHLILEHLQKIQRANQIAPSNKLEGRSEGFNLTIEMETGVGKTYTYIKTMYELNRAYGGSKFIIVVPSIAIREGVYKSFEMTQEHFAEEYGKKIRFFIYNSTQLTEIDRFASDSSINVMIINSQAFNAKGKDARRIYMKLDEFRSRRPIDIIAKTNPILIIDEPQSVEGKQTKENLKKFNPMITLRYSATHKSDSIYNMIYRLDAMEAYNNNQLSYALVEHKDYQMSRILLQMDEVDQENALKSIDDNYAEATGYGHFENYDRFGDIMYTFILNSKNISLQRAATRILEGCASYRYHSKELLDTVRTKFPQLNVSE